MAFQPVPDTARFAIIHQSPTDDVLINVLYFRRTGQWSLTELSQAAEVLAQAWLNEVLPHLSINTSFRRVQARGERVIDDVSFEYIVDPPRTGLRGGQPVPYQCAFCVTHLTGLTGRANRGRTYFGYLSEDDNDAGLISLPRAIGLRNALVGVRSAMLGVNWTHVVVSRVRNRVRLPVAVTVPVIGYKFTDLVIDTQRRRRIGQGA